jgi:dissimilatory sulfite reductase (desulfoviridin) alpha/beta subunit
LKRRERETGGKKGRKKAKQSRRFLPKRVVAERIHVVPQIIDRVIEYWKEKEKLQIYIWYQSRYKWYDWIHERIDQSIHIGSRGLI